MKIAVIGDTHLGRTLYGYDLTPAIRATMYSFFRFCQEHKVSMAIHLGDMFETPRPTLALEKMVIQWLNEFERAGIDLHVLVGNHDVVSSGGVNSALSPIKAIGCYKHIRIHETPTFIYSTTHSLRSGEPGSGFLFLPFPSPAIYDGHADWLTAVNSEIVRIKGNAIVFSHLNAEGAILGGQDWVYRGGDYCLPPELPHDERVALVVSGHIHDEQWMPGRHLILGASQLLRFSEKHNPCRFLLLENPEGQDGCSFYETGAEVRLVQWEVDASAWGSGGEAPGGDEVLAAAPDVEGAIVKVQPFVDEHTAIDWGRVEAVLYEDGAEFVKMLSPIFAKRKVKQKPKAAVVGEPVRAAAFFIRSKVQEPAEQKAVMRAFRRVQEDADAS